MNKIRHLRPKTFVVTALQVIFCFAIFTLFSCHHAGKEVVVDLKCNNQINPEGIDFPVFSWKIHTSQSNFAQTAWELEIASQEDMLKKGKADVWKSGKQISDQQFGIRPDAELMETQAYYWRVRIWYEPDLVTAWSEPAYFSIGLINEEAWKAQWITFPYSDDEPLPYFRKEFKIDHTKKPAKALVYFCGLGAGELYLNGKHIDSSRFLDPSQTNYEHYALYNTFDVTQYLEKEDNCLGVIIGNGWFSQDEAWSGAPFSYGNPMFRLRLVVLYEDGSRYDLGSDQTWKWKEGPITKTNIYLGENYDARNEIEDWNKYGLSETRWNEVAIATENMPPRLLPQQVEPIRKKEIVTAKEIWQDSLGNWIYDFGVNVAGVPLLEVTQPEGTHLGIRFAEAIDIRKGLDFISTGWIHHGDIFKDNYICKGDGKEIWSPRFTYHGYRYAELSGFNGNPDLQTLRLVVVHTDVENSGTFECADEQINLLHEMCLRTVTANLHGIPTDCPIREKCGWLGDVHAYVKMANLNFQMENFWLKYLEDIRSGALKEEKNTLFHERYNNTFYFEDKPAGIPYMIAPGKRLCGVASPDWGTALVQVPWWLYVYYGNRQVLEEYYPSMKQWTEYVSSLAKNKERTKEYNPKTSSIVYQGLGDWCPPIYELEDATPVEFTSTAFHYLDTYIMEQTAELLEKEEDRVYFAAKKEEIRHEMVAEMYDADKNTFGSQTADALALDLGFVPKGDEKAVADAIVTNMDERSEGFMRCGIFGLCRIGSVLARNGNADKAWNMFTKKGENSFEWMWKEANATTLWELLPVNQMSQDQGYSASYNHPMQAGFDVTFIEDIAGIRPDAAGYGFKVIRFQPLFCDYLTWAKASIQSVYGEVSSHWEKEEGKFKWSLSIPPNSTGLVVVPYENDIQVNGSQLDQCYFIQKVTIDNGKTTAYYFPSGEFTISALSH